MIPPRFEKEHYSSTILFGGRPKSCLAAVTALSLEQQGMRWQAYLFQLPGRSSGGCQTDISKSILPITFVAGKIHWNGSVSTLSQSVSCSNADSSIPPKAEGPCKCERMSGFQQASQIPKCWLPADIWNPSWLPCACASANCTQVRDWPVAELPGATRCQYLGQK